MVFYPVLDELQSVMPDIKHITKPSTLEEGIVSALKTSNVSAQVVSHLSAEVEDTLNTFAADIRLSLSRAEVATQRNISAVEIYMAKLVKESEERILAAIQQDALQ